MRRSQIRGGQRSWSDPPSRNREAKEISSGRLHRHSLTVEGSNLIVTAKVNGRPMPFYFDTGAGASIMPLQMLQTMGDQGFRKVGESDATGAAGTTKASGIRSIRLNWDRFETGTGYSRVRRL
ncbi:MAG: retropepsin-like aspartic protease [Cyanobacteriota/Melainabacteria group bacterium]